MSSVKAALPRVPNEYLCVACGQIGNHWIMKCRQRKVKDNMFWHKIEYLILHSNRHNQRSFEVIKWCRSSSTLITTILEGHSNSDEIDINGVNGDELELMAKWLNHHHTYYTQKPNIDINKAKTIINDDMNNDNIMTKLSYIFDDEWDIQLITKIIEKGKHFVIKLILAANYMGIDTLMHMMIIVYSLYFPLDIHMILNCYIFLWHIQCKYYDQHKNEELALNILTKIDAANQFQKNSKLIACLQYLLKEKYIYNYIIHKKLDLMIFSLMNYITTKSLDELKEDIIYNREISPLYRPISQNQFGIGYGQPGSNLTKPNWSDIVLPKFEKNLYHENMAITQISDRQVLQWRQNNNIMVAGYHVPTPIYTFQEAGFPQYILTDLNRTKLDKPTAIQSQGLPMIMNGLDLIGIVKSGSGKILTYILPCIIHINAQPLLRNGDGPIVLIIAPTRELAIEIEKEVSKFAYTSRIKQCCVHGGSSRDEQVEKLKFGAEIIICTPGRLLAFLDDNITNLLRVTYLVIDGVDRLLDMGYKPQLNAILSQIRPDRQLIMWSSIWIQEIKRFCAKYFISNEVGLLSIGCDLYKELDSLKQFVEQNKSNHNFIKIDEIVVYGYVRRLELNMMNIPQSLMQIIQANVA